MCKRIPGDSWGFPKITGYSERVTGDLKGFLGIAGVSWRKKPSGTPIIYMFVWKIFLTIQPDPTMVFLGEADKIWLNKITLNKKIGICSNSCVCRCESYTTCFQPVCGHIVTIPI